MTARMRKLAIIGIRLLWIPVAVVLLAMPCHAVTANHVAGLYEIETYTMMPHLEEMRRIRKLERRCVTTGDVTSLFPVMRQSAFRGCALLPRSSNAGEYSLRCQTGLVATGTAVLSHGRDGVSGTLSVKMGGKNMTFSQHTTATHLGPCEDPPPD